MNDTIVKNIVESVRKKKTLVNLDDRFILDELSKIIAQKPKLDLSKAKNLKDVVKKIRAKAYPIYDVFQTKDILKRKDLLNAGKYDELLMTHLSTKERFSDYPTIFSSIFDITGKPKSVLDLGCGLNPIAFKYMGITDVKYIASEFSQADCDFVLSFFKKEGIDSSVVKLDLVKDVSKLGLYKADVCFLFKVLDSIETLKLNITYKILSAINCKFIVASFPIKGVGQRDLRLQTRPWFEKMCLKLGYSYKVIKTSNEIFYVVQK